MLLTNQISLSKKTDSILKLMVAPGAHFNND